MGEAPEPLKLYILRHGDAPSALEAGVRSDAERPLSSAGRQNVRRAAETLNRRGAGPRVILTSPLTRARQTAEEAAAVLASRPRIAVYEPLANRVSGGELLERILEDRPASGELLIVGHQPQLGELAHRLAGAPLPLSPAGLIAVEIRGTESRLLWNQEPSAAA